MATINSLIDWEYSDEEYEYNKAINDKLDFKVDDVEKMKQEIENLKDALIAVNAILKTKQQQHANDVKMYELKVEEIKMFCNEYFEKLVNEHDAKLKQLDDDYDDNLKKLQEYRDQPLPRTASMQCQTSFPRTVKCPGDGNEADDEKDEEADRVEIVQLKQKVAELTFANNRYHHAVSFCTLCTSEYDDASNDSSVDLFTASTPKPHDLSSSGPVLVGSVAPPLQDKQRKKDQAYICRLLKIINKLEVKYSIPEHKRKARLFKRKKRENSIIPKEFSTIFHVLSAPEPDVNVLEPYPQVKWNDVRFKPALPNPELCAIHSCSEDPKFYQDQEDFPSTFKRWAPHSFGTLPGFKTSLGIVAVPAKPVSGYVYCPDDRKWVIYAEPRSLAPASRGTRKGRTGTSLLRRRKGQERDEERPGEKKEKKTTLLPAAIFPHLVV